MAIPFIFWILGGLIFGGGVVAVALWSHIRELFTTTVIPFVREKLGAPLANTLGSLISFIDTPASLARSQAKALYRTFKKNFFGISTTYELQGDARVKSKTEVIALDAGRVMRYPLPEQVVDLTTLPAEVQQRLRENGIPVQIDHQESLVKNLELALGNDSGKEEDDSPDVAKERCPRCEFSYGWDGRTCLHCAYAA